MEIHRPSRPSPSLPDGYAERQAAFTQYLRRWRKTATAQEKREWRADQRYFREWLKKIDRWQAHPRYAGVTFPGIKDGDRAAEELVQFARDFVKERI